MNTTNDLLDKSCSTNPKAKKTQNRISRLQVPVKDPPKSKCLCYSRLPNEYAHPPPGSAEREWNEGSLEAMVSMEHAARRRGDPWSGNGAEPGSDGNSNKLAILTEERI